MPTAYSGLSFSIFLSAFPLTMFLGLLCSFFLGVGKFARTTRISRAFLIRFWIICWAAACGIALTTWQMQRNWLHTNALPSGSSYGTISYFEQHGYTAAQALHYHNATFVGLNGFQTLHNQSLSAMIWYAILFLLLPAVPYGIDQRRAQFHGAAVSAAL